MKSCVHLKLPELDILPMSSNSMIIVSAENLDLLPRLDADVHFSPLQYLLQFQNTCPSRQHLLGYSPNNLRTRFRTLSFSGSYGWSLDGISSNDGNAAV